MQKFSDKLMGILTLDTVKVASIFATTGSLQAQHHSQTFHQRRLLR
jgi:hypothetical protein